MSRVAFHPLTPKYTRRAVDCISRSFTHAERRDPFTTACQLKQADWKRFTQLFVERAAKQENPMSFIALNPDTKQIEGVIINEDWKEPLPPDYENTQSVWRPVRAIFKELHVRYMAQRKIQKGMVLHPLYFSCVLPESRRQGILSGLWRHSVDVAREFNFQYMAAEASSSTVRQVVNSFGFDEKASVKYDEFMFEGDKVFEPLVAKHKKEFDRISLYERRITSDLFV